jgi:hypothetical protein
MPNVTPKAVSLEGIIPIPECGYGHVLADWNESRAGVIEARNFPALLRPKILTSTVLTTRATATATFPTAIAATATTAAATLGFTFALGFAPGVAFALRIARRAHLGVG